MYLKETSYYQVVINMTSDNDKCVCYECGKTFTWEETGFRMACKPCQIVNAEHPQVETDFGFLCDEKILPLINALNSTGITTTNSCQDNFGEIWVGFHSHYDVLLLNKLLAMNDEDLFDDLTRNWTVVFDYYDEEDDSEVTNTELSNVTSDFHLRFDKELLDDYMPRIIKCLS